MSEVFLARLYCKMSDLVGSLSLANLKLKDNSNNEVLNDLFSAPNFLGDGFSFLGDGFSAFQLV